MTDTAVTTFVPTGHPVRRFVIVLAAICAICAITWWSGLAAPRLTATPPTSQYDHAVEQGTVRFRVRNATPLRVDVIGVTVGDPRIEIRTVRAGGKDLATGGVALGGGAVVTLEVDYAGDCVLPHPPLARPMRLLVSTVLGLERSHTVVDAVELIGLACN